MVFVVKVELCSNDNLQTLHSIILKHSAWWYKIHGNLNKKYEKVKKRIEKDKNSRTSTKEALHTHLPLPIRSASFFLLSSKVTLRDTNQVNLFILFWFFGF